MRDMLYALLVRPVHLFFLLAFFSVTASGAPAFTCGGAETPTPPFSLALIAGNDYGPGMRDARGFDARFSAPANIVRDRHGNLFVADSGNHTIRKILHDLSVETFVGRPGVRGHLDGRGSDALLTAPVYLGIDASDNLYVTDQVHHSLRRITPDGKVSTLAGSAGTPGDADGIGAGARFNKPAGVTADTAGNVYVADTGNAVIRKVSPVGLVTTYAGIRGDRRITDGRTQEATFIGPLAIANDLQGKLYVADGYFGFSEPNSLANQSVIRRLDPANTITLFGTLLRSQSTAPPSPAPRLGRVTSMAADSGGSLYLADGLLHRVSQQGQSALLLARSPGMLNLAAGVAVDSERNLYFTDAGDHVVRMRRPDGSTVSLAGAALQLGADNGIGRAARFNGPRGIAIDVGGNVYVADVYNHVIRKVSPDGIVSTLAGRPGVSGYQDGPASAALFNFPYDVAVGPNGSVYVADSVNNAVREISPRGIVSTIRSSAVAGDSSGEVRPTSNFSDPRGIATDREGNLFVADHGSQTIRKVSLAGAITIVAGRAGQSGYVDGPAAEARFSNLVDIDVYRDGTLFVIDNGTIRKIDRSGMVTTMAGISGKVGLADGPGTVARFFAPSSIVVDGIGTVYVSDSFNHRIRRVSPTGVVSTLAVPSGENLYLPSGLIVTGPCSMVVSAGQGVFRLAPK